LGVEVGVVEVGVVMDPQELKPVKMLRHLMA
jgi:hypothetical protein